MRPIRWRRKPPAKVVLWHDFYQSTVAGPMPPEEVAAWAATDRVGDPLLILDASDHRRVVGYLEPAPRPNPAIEASTRLQPWMMASMVLANASCWLLCVWMPTSLPAGLATAR